MLKHKNTFVVLQPPTPFLSQIKKIKSSVLIHPNPDENVLRQLNRKIYAFIWDGKPGKVNRELLCQE